MYPRIAHIYGPLWINSYGLMIVLGLVLSSFLSFRYLKKRHAITADLFTNMLMWAVIGGFAGGRFYIVITEWHIFSSNPIELLYPWVGGFGILGAIAGVIVSLTAFFIKNKLPVLAMFDGLALFAPLMQAFSRVGCFLAGCCYGYQSSDLWCAVTYTDPESLAPLHVPLHPAQLYSTLASLGVFLILYVGVVRCAKRAGTIFWSYLALESLARFIVDFWRGDTIKPTLWLAGNNIGTWFTSAQWVALGLSGCALLGWLISTRRSQKSS